MQEAIYQRPLFDRSRSSSVIQMPAVVRMADDRRGSMPDLNPLACTTPRRWPAVPAPAPTNTVSFIVYENTPDAANNELLRKEVRSKAARSSAALRKATMAKKFGQRAQARKAAAEAAAQLERSNLPPSTIVSANSVKKTPTSAKSTDVTTSSTAPTSTSPRQAPTKKLKREMPAPPAPNTAHSELKLVPHDPHNHSLNTIEPAFPQAEFAQQYLQHGAPLLSSPRMFLPSERIMPLSGGTDISNFEGIASTYGHSNPSSPLWREILHFGPLYQAVLLVTGSHGLPSFANPVVLYFKQSAIESMKNAVMQASMSGKSTDDRLVPAIALLAGWEHKYGDVRAYNTHMQVLLDISSKGTSLDPDGRNRLVASLEDMVLNAGPNLAANASKRSAFFDDPPPLPGFVELQEKGLVDPLLATLMARLASLDTSKPDIGLRLRGLFLQLSAWRQPDPPEGLPAAMHSQWTQCHWQLRAVAQVLTGVLANFSRNIDFFMSVQDGMNIHKIMPAILKSAQLANTEYAAASLWAVTFQLIGPGVRTREDLENMRILLASLRIGTFEAFEDLLSRYSYPRLLLGPRCWDLWQDIIQIGPLVHEVPPQFFAPVPSTEDWKHMTFNSLARAMPDEKFEPEGEGIDAGFGVVLWHSPQPEEV